MNEKSKEARNLPSDKKIVSFVNTIKLDLDVRKDDMVYFADTTDTKMAMITQKQLYEDAILRKSRDHIYQTKWQMKIPTLILWDEVWKSVHHFLLLNKTKTAIWEQLHLNFYTQYSYNKWHGSLEMCPLCNLIPESIYHTILNCDFVKTLWTKVTPTLMKLHDKPVDDEEKALGIVHIKKSNGMVLRNLITYMMRELILNFERKAYHTSKIPSMNTFEAKFNQSIAALVKNWMYKYSNENKLNIFENIFTYKSVLCVKVQVGEYCIKKIF